MAALGWLINLDFAAGTADVSVATTAKHSMMPHQNMRRAVRRNRNRNHRFEALWLALRTIYLTALRTATT